MTGAYLASSRSTPLFAAAATIKHWTLQYQIFRSNSCWTTPRSVIQFFFSHCCTSCSFLWWISYFTHFITVFFVWLELIEHCNLLLSFSDAVDTNFLNRQIFVVPSQGGVQTPKLVLRYFCSSANWSMPLLWRCCHGWFLAKTTDYCFVIRIYQNAQQ